MWPKTILPSAVAGPFAAKAPCNARGREGRRRFGTGRVQPSRPLGVASECGVEEFQLDVGIHRDDIEQVERAAVEPGAGRRGAVGDPLHFFKVFGVVTPRGRGRCDHGCGPRPGVDGGLIASFRGEGVDVIGDLGREQAAVLVAAIIRLAFDVDDDPAGAGITIGRTVANGSWLGRWVRWRWLGLASRRVNTSKQREAGREPQRVGGAVRAWRVP